MDPYCIKVVRVHILTYIYILQLFCSLAINVSRPEEERLRLENEQLKAKINHLKTSLILCEIKNGGKAKTKLNGLPVYQNLPVSCSL